MRHSIRYEKRAGYASIRLVCDDADSYVEVIPALGGTVSRLAFNTGDGSREVLRADSNDELASGTLFRGRLLFPWNDRIPGGTYAFGGKRYSLPVNDPAAGGSIHGFLYRHEMRLLGALQNSDCASIRLGYRVGPDECEGYPFPLKLDVEYALSGNRFELVFRVENAGTGRAPVAFGWHPYFLFGTDGEGAALKAAFPSYYETDSSALPTGTVIGLRRGMDFDFSESKPVADLALDHAFFSSRRGEIIMRMNGMSVLLSQDPNVFRFNQLYVPPERDSIAVEPVTAAPDSFNRPERGLCVLDAGAVLSGSISLRLLS